MALVRKIWMHADTQAERVTMDVQLTTDEIKYDVAVGRTLSISNLPPLARFGICPVSWENMADLTLELAEPIPLETLLAHTKITKEEEEESSRNGDRGNDILRRAGYRV